MNTSSLLNRLIPILYEDERILAVAKPAGVDVGGLPHENMTGPGSVLEPPRPGSERVGVRVDAAGITPRPTSPLKGRGVFGQGLAELVSLLRGRNETLFPANRLSRFESGVLLLGKDPGTAARIRAALRSLRVEQEYVAVVNGRMKKPMLVVDAQRDSSPEKPEHGKRPVRPSRSAARATRPAPPGSRTILRRLEQGEHRTLIRCETTAPTTHALRAQLRSAGLRLVGDRLHDRSIRPTAHEDTCLHLARVRLQLPGQKEPMTLRSPAPEGFAAAVCGERGLERLLHAALTRRLPCLLEPDTDSFRLLTGPVEGIAGLIAEKYGPVVVLQVLESSPRWLESLPAIARWCCDLLQVRAVYVKRFVKNRNPLSDDVQDSLHSPKPLLGEPAPPQVEIVERGLRFAIRPYDGFSVGLFLDQRDNRSRIRELSQDKDVLNLFAYTCGFSVAAAAGGAKSTASVDVSPKHLEWGRTNFALNGLELTNHDFIRSDAAEYLNRAKRQGRQFDLMVLDPPSFAHGRKSKHDFSILDDLSGLVSTAGEILRPGGVMMVSTNHRKLSRRGLLDRVRQGLATRRCEVMATPPLPPDFAIDPDHAKTIVVRLASTQQ